MRGVFVTGTGTEVGKTVVAAVIARGLAAAGERVAVFKPAVTGLDEPAARPTTSCCGGRPARLRATTRSRPTATDPPVSPHLGAELAGEPIDPGRLLARRARRPAPAPTRWSARGSAGCSSR